MKIIVTGGAGFIGGHLVQRLINDGHEVVVIDDLSNGKLENIATLPDSKKMIFIKSDMRDIETMKYYSKDCRMAIHLAANPDVRIGNENSSIDFELNIVATKQLLEVIKHNDVLKKIIFASTSTVYGEPAVKPTSESYGPLAPISLYGGSKLACESLISAYCHFYKKKGVIFRLANVTGSRANHGIIYDFARKLLKSYKTLEILGDGKQNKSYLHVSDCVEAFMLGLRDTQDGAVEFFNVGSRDAIDVVSIADIVIKKFSAPGKTELQFRTTVDGGRGWNGDVKEMLLDSSKIRSIGWVPKHDSSRAAVMKAAEEIIAEVKR